MCVRCSEPPRFWGLPPLKLLQSSSVWNWFLHVRGGGRSVFSPRGCLIDRPDGVRRSLQHHATSVTNQGTVPVRLRSRDRCARGWGCRGRNTQRSRATREVVSERVRCWGRAGCRRCCRPWTRLRAAGGHPLLSVLGALWGSPWAHPARAPGSRIEAPRARGLQRAPTWRGQLGRGGPSCVHPHPAPPATQRHLGADRRRPLSGAPWGPGGRWLLIHRVSRLFLRGLRGRPSSGHAPLRPLGLSFVPPVFMFSPVAEVVFQRHVIHRAPPNPQ